jgi:hypothetical protein
MNFFFFVIVERGVVVKGKKDKEKKKRENDWELIKLAADLQSHRQLSAPAIDEAIKNRRRGE